jgi:tetratricopeptide (TPR) repeat protein
MKTSKISTAVLASLSISLGFPLAASANVIQLSYGKAGGNVQAQIPGTPRPEVINAARQQYEQRQREIEAWARSPHNPENQDPEIRSLGRIDRYFFYYDRGLKRREQNDLAGALSDYNKAIYFYAEDSFAYNGRGVVKVKLNDLSGALADYNRAIELEGGRSPTQLYNRGLLKQRLNDREGAIQDLRRAAKLYKEQGKTEDYQDALDRLQKMNATL